MWRPLSIAHVIGEGQKQVPLLLYSGSQQGGADVAIDEEGDLNPGI
jgi:hypothetical protein